METVHLNFFYILKRQGHCLLELNDYDSKIAECVKRGYDLENELNKMGYLVSRSGTWIKIFKY